MRGHVSHELFLKNIAVPQQKHEIQPVRVEGPVSKTLISAYLGLKFCSMTVFTFL